MTAKFEFEGHTYQPWYTHRITINGTTIIATVNTDGASIATIATHRINGWCYAFQTVADAFNEARRIRDLIERYGSIDTVDRLRTKLGAELATCTDTTRQHAIDRQLDELENCFTRHANNRLTDGVTKFLAR